MEGADGEGGSGRRGESEFLVARSQFGACAAERVAYLLQDVVLAKRNGEEETVEAGEIDVVRRVSQTTISKVDLRRHEGKRDERTDILLRSREQAELIHGRDRRNE